MLKVDSTEQHKQSPGTAFVEKNVHGAGDVVNYLLLAWKNCSLYPDGHIAAIKALENLTAAFEIFFATHNCLQLTVEKNRLLSKTAVLHEIPPDSSSEDLVTILYRDGIQWLAFHRGLSLNELIYFFSILKKYRLLAEETEGDVVTGLTDGNLEHIDFKAIDIFWEDLPPLDFASLTIIRPEAAEPARQADSVLNKNFREIERGEIQARSIADPSYSEALWEISATEQKELRKMVQEEENWDNTEDVLDVLLVILRSQSDQYSFSSVLDFAMEEVVETFQQGEFRQLLNFFQSLHQLLYRNTTTELSWRRPLIERFFQDLSQDEILRQITDRLLLLAAEETAEVQALREILLYCSPSIIPALGPVLLQTEHRAVEKMILEVIEYLCLRDMAPLETLLDQPERKLGERLLPVLTRLRGQRSNRIFFKMSEHSSEKVRSEAVRILLGRDPDSVIKLFRLINDPSLEIRRLILGGIAKQRSPVLENLMLNHLKENVDHRDAPYIRACYEALGRCGSDKAIPYLRRILLDRGWNRFVGPGKPVHRQGAATALTLLDSPQTEDILLQAAGSIFRVVRTASHKAVQARDASGEDPNG